MYIYIVFVDIINSAHLKNINNCAGNNALVLFSQATTTTNGVCFTRSSLTIGKDCAINAIKKLTDQWINSNRVNLYLHI